MPIEMSESEMAMARNKLRTTRTVFTKTCNKLEKSLSKEPSMELLASIRLMKDKLEKMFEEMQELANVVALAAEDDERAKAEELEKITNYWDTWIDVEIRATNAIGRVLTAVGKQPVFGDTFQENLQTQMSSAMEGRVHTSRRFARFRCIGKIRNNA